LQLAPERAAAARQYQHAVEAHGVGSKAVRAIEQDALRRRNMLERWFFGHNLS
jgi:hypothetical protein